MAETRTEMTNDQFPMTNPHQKTKALILIIAGIILTLLIFLATILPNGEREVSTIENINGVDFPIIGNAYVVSEQLAHADIFLNQPGFGKDVEFTITFTPHDLETLHVGIRDNAFWLSYEPIEIYNRNSVILSEEKNLEGTTQITKTLTIPLTDKLQDRDQSLDLMFFATSTTSTSPLEKGGERGVPVITDAGKIDIPAIETWLADRTSDETYWELHSLTASTKAASLKGLNNKLRIADWLFSIARRERPL